MGTSKAGKFSKASKFSKSGKTSLKNKKTWGELPPGRRAGVIAVGVVQVTLLILAQRDISRRPAELIRGPKAAWRLASFINFVGPMGYFIFGRLKTPTKP
ncbi:PLD nuclease N-terminal domain-containing protein [Pseudarthrobacter sp. J47]|uniref:PLD nuclease N-terminal domain-containing protein n=1 Tax=Pseudarthrobacter sp. J47 TaxID=3116482 RepID=UPI002E81CAFE|nr:PLD nuclease N-terminal domain-containing protein [Pseudarthrobacter sp. J47]MEE2523265.1 PLD nuclease N-terminal domain-containing protein [Pseudarthrobacter sp. J47]